MDLGLRGRRALVMGASRGLGRACAEALAREGVAVTIVARDAERLAQAAAEIGAASGMVVATVSADFRTEGGRAAALAACPDPDILVTNAEGAPPGDFRAWSRDEWLAGADDMMLGPIALIRATIDGMCARGFGRIVNIVSRSVKIPQAELGLSNGARSGLIGFCAGLAREVAGRNVTINNLLPGIFAADAQRRHVEGLVAMTGRPFDEIWAARARANPAGRYGEPAELGAMCAFLCSAQAGYVTGQSVLVDGGAYPGTF
jgi:3-oxoacyl-[acyl-carrier protein] reductase